MKFICKNCNDSVEVDSIEDIIKMQKLCIFCKRSLQHNKGVNTFKKNHKIFINKCLNCKCDIETFINRDGKPNKKYCSQNCYYEYNKRDNILTCEYCNNTFIGKKAKYCSKKCRSKGVENYKFKKGLDEANKLIEIQNIKVYGFGSSRYEDNKLKKDLEDDKDLK